MYKCHIILETGLVRFGCQLCLDGKPCLVELYHCVKVVTLTSRNEGGWIGLEVAVAAHLAFLRLRLFI